MRPSGIGGMAVMEGVMMKNKEEYAVAVRKPNNEIAVEKNIHKDFSDKVKLFKLPIFRGILAFVDSMVIGIKVLNFSASFFEVEEELKSKEKKEKKGKKAKADKKAAVADADFEIEDLSASDSSTISISEAQTVETSNEKKKDDTALMMFFAVTLSIILSVALFMVLPVVLMQLLTKIVTSNFVLNLIEGFVRLGIFIGYVLLATLMPEIKRTFMYHGAEHKTINCLENGLELTVANVKKQTKQHKRCGTSFMLLVVLISLVLFIIVPTGDNLIIKILSRVLLVPIIAGVSYEFIRLAGRSENKIVDILSKPGLWMQGLTTKEPDDSMIEVAIESVGAVFDWRAFLEEGNKDSKKSGKKNSSTAKKEQPSKEAAETAKPEKKNVAKKEEKAKTAATAKTAEADKKQTEPKESKEIKEKITAAPSKYNSVDEEDDEILKALDKFFDEGNTEKAASGK